MRWLVAIGSVVLLLAVGRHFLNAPVNARATGVVSVEISEGSGARAVSRKLAAAGLVRSPTGFVVQAILSGARGRIQAGTYAFSPRESGFAILERLVRGDATPLDLALTFPEGFTLDQIAERLAARGIVGKDEFGTVARVGNFRKEFSFLESAPAGASLEGYLFPDTYRFHRGSKPEEIIRRLLTRFGEQWKVAADVPLPNTVHALVTMASIVEREVRSPEDRRLVAGILWKRHALGIGLEADATIRYVTGNWEQPLTVADLRIDSPYNTRRYRGLPPGPIGNPGLESLKATLNPEPSDYLYYLSAPDGRTIFSVTLDEHNRAKAQHLTPPGVSAEGER